MNTWLHILAYDKYHDAKVIISFNDDEINMDSFYSAGSSWKILIQASGIWIEDYEPKRWSDLIDKKIISEKEKEHLLSWKSIYKKKSLPDL